VDHGFVVSGQALVLQPASELAQLMAHVSRWLDGQGLMPEELTEGRRSTPAPRYDVIKKAA
jgi:hypothetical protein